MGKQDGFQSATWTLLMDGQPVATLQCPGKHDWWYGYGLEEMKEPLGGVVKTMRG